MEACFPDLTTRLLAYFHEIEFLSIIVIKKQIARHGTTQPIYQHMLPLALLPCPKNVIKTSQFEAQKRNLYSRTLGAFYRTRSYG